MKRNLPPATLTAAYAPRGGSAGSMIRLREPAAGARGAPFPYRDRHLAPAPAVSRCAACGDEPGRPGRGGSPPRRQHARNDKQGRGDAARRHPHRCARGSRRGRSRDPRGYVPCARSRSGMRRDQAHSDSRFAGGNAICASVEPRLRGRRRRAPALRQSDSLPPGFDPSR